jgi:hypothetical protein
MARSVITCLFLVAGGASFADESYQLADLESAKTIPVTILIDPTTHTQRGIYDGKTNEDGSQNFLESMYDHDVGILCEWDTLYHQQRLEMSNVRCASAKEPPAFWMFATEKVLIDKYMNAAAELPVQDAENPFVIVEYAHTQNSRDYRTTTTKRWNMNKEEVCITLQKGFGAVANLTIFDLGCFDARANNHFRHLIEFMGLRPIVPT